MSRIDFNRLRIPAGLTMAGLSLAGLVACGGKSAVSPDFTPTSPPPTTEAPPIPTPAPSTDALVSSVTLNLDFSKLEPNGTCQDGNPRPCFEPLRTKPTFTDSTDFLNKIGTYNGAACAEWPYEGHGTARVLCQDGLTQVVAGEGHGNPLTVVCQVGGAAVTAFGRPESDPSRISNVWDVVEVLPEHMSPAALTRAEAANPGFGVQRNQQGNITKVYGFVPDMWLGDHGVYAQLPPCTTAQNPSHFASAQQIQ